MPVALRKDPRGPVPILCSLIELRNSVQCPKYINPRFCLLTNVQSAPEKHSHSLLYSCGFQTCLSSWYYWSEKYTLPLSVPLKLAESTMKIVIVGAGVSGLSTYLFLRKHLPTP